MEHANHAPHLNTSEISSLLIESASISVGEGKLCFPISQSCSFSLSRTRYGTHVDETAISLSEELVGSSNVHAAVVGVQNAKTELDGGLSVDVGRIGDREIFVVAGRSLEALRIRVPSHHLVCGLLRESLATGVEVRDVTDECNNSSDSLVDDSGGGSGTSRGQNGSRDRLTLDEDGSRVLGRVSGLERGGVKTTLGSRNGRTVNDDGAASDSGDHGRERRHIERIEFPLSHRLKKVSKCELKRRVEKKENRL